LETFALPKSRSRRNLAMGRTMFKYIKQNKPQILRDIKQRMREEKRQNRGVDHEHERAEQRKRDRNMRKWLKRKEHERAKEEAAARVHAQATSPTPVSQLERDQAYVNWMDRKQQERREARKPVPEEPHGFRIEELQNACTDLVSNDEQFSLCNAVFLELVAHKSPQTKGLPLAGASTRNDGEGSVDPGDFDTLWAQARMHRLLTDKIHKLKPKKDGEVPQLGEAEKHMLRHQQHLADGILSSLKTNKNIFGDSLKNEQHGRTMFGSVMATTRQFYETVDYDNNGGIDKAEFVLLCNRLDLGADQREMEDMFHVFCTAKPKKANIPSNIPQGEDGVEGDADVKPEQQITYAGFEDILVTAEAHRHVDGAPPPSQPVTLALQIMDAIGEEESKELFVDIFVKSMQDRIEAGIAKTGSIGFWEFQGMLKKIESPTGSPVQSRAFQQIYDRVFRKLASRTNDGLFCKIADIMFFNRKLMLHINATADKKRGSDGRSKSLQYRVGKKIFKNFEENSVYTTTGGKGQGGNVIDHSTLVFSELADPEGGISRQTMALLCGELGFHLSPCQIDDLYMYLDKDGNGSIDLDEWTRYLEETSEQVAKERQDAKEASDPRSNLQLVHALMTHVSGKPDVMGPMVARIKELFEEVANTKPKASPEKGQGNSAPRSARREGADKLAAL